MKFLSTIARIPLRVNVPSSGRSTFSTAVFLNKGSQEEIAHVKDMSVHGLCYDSLRAAVKNVMTTPAVQSSSADTKSSSTVSPLGRWKVGTDNFEKSYSYDHSA